VYKSVSLVTRSFLARIVATAALDNMSQPEGSYPRLNASSLNTDNYNGMIVNLVGKFQVQNQFICSDGGVVNVATEHASPPEGLPANAVVEIVGQCMGRGHIAVSVTTRTTNGNLSRFMSAFRYSRTDA